jgi:single-strand DNA-binding protein
MAFSLNRAQIIGNLTRDPEVRVAGGQKVATFGVATSFSWKDQTGVRKEKTEFHNIVAWRKLAEICEQYLRKGSKVYIDGRIQTRDWEGEDGVKRYRTEILIENMIMLDKKSTTTGGPFNAPDEDREQRSIKEKKSATEGEGEKATPQPQEEEVSIEDLPF